MTQSQYTLRWILYLIFGGLLLCLLALMYTSGDQEKTKLSEQRALVIQEGKRLKDKKFLIERAREDPLTDKDSLEIEYQILEMEREMYLIDLQLLILK